jgi:hypothetical protein
MKTNLAHLSRVYQDYAKGGANGEPCVDPERLARCAMGDMSPHERDEIVGHAADCSACAAALKRLLSLSAEAERAAADFGALLGRRKAKRAQARDAFWKRPIFVPVAAISAGILLLTTSILLIPGFMSRSGTRGVAKAGVVLVSPVEERVSTGAGVVLKWEKLAGATSYTIEVFDRSMSLLWRSGRTAGTEAGLPAETVRKMVPGETYFWMVTALTEDRRETKSKLAEFSITK